MGIFTVFLVFFAPIVFAESKSISKSVSEFSAGLSDATGHLNFDFDDLEGGIEEGISAAGRELSNIGEEIGSAVGEGAGAVRQTLGSVADYSLCDMVYTKKIIKIDENPEAKFNILFVGDMDSGYSTPDLLKQNVVSLLDFKENNRNAGFFSIEPFKANRNKFNIYAVRARVSTDMISNSNPASKALSVWMANCAAAKARASSQKKIDYVVVLSKKDFRSLCFPETPCLVSIGRSITKRDARVLMHEFGHGFAGLADEYVDAAATEMFGDMKGVSTALFGRSIQDVNDLFSVIGIIAPPNCVTPRNYDPNSKHASWGGKWKGCAFKSSNYKPPYSTIMGSDVNKGFGAVNEKRIKDIINGKVKILRKGSLTSGFQRYK